jgi:peptidoglycan/LPS O-acetylase OafA/YrhL
MSTVALVALVGALKAFAAQAIVLHHLAAYGPMSVDAWKVMPAILMGCYDYGRLAVQVFLVVGGFLAARSLFPRDWVQPVSLWKPIKRRYVRLVIPYLAALALAIACAAVARRFMVDESIPASPTLMQWLAHVMLLQGPLGFESLSAGVWYIAIDFQAFALMAVMLRLGRGRGRLFAPMLIMAMATAALFGFNRDTSWDDWAPYFFGSYGLGAAAWLSCTRRNSTVWLGGMAILTIAALMLDFRLRIMIALAVALVLGFGVRSGLLDRWRLPPPIAFLGRISFSVFLVHYPIALVVNTVYELSGISAPFMAVAMLVATWAASIAAGALFHRYVEGPAAIAKITATLGSLIGRIDKSRRGLPDTSPRASNSPSLTEPRQDRSGRTASRAGHV